MNTTFKVIGGFLAGTAIGLAAGVLLAPESGKRTRKRVVDESIKFKDQLADSVIKSLDSVKSTYNRKVDEYAKTGKSSVDNLKESMKV